jgi:soluble lytic murein transglycosylase
MHKFKSIAKIIITLVVVCILLYIYSKTFIYKTTYLEYIEKSCSGSSIDPYLVLSIIRVESGFRPDAISSKEAKGLMQIKDTTYSEVSDMFATYNDNIDPYDPETNIKIGVAYLKKLLNKYGGNYYIALLAYNGGMGNVNNWINSGIISNNLNETIVPDIPFKETRDYLRKVITTYNIYKFLYNK